jgi:U3 small nucleolar RNA-associated protein 14
MVSELKNAIGVLTREAIEESHAQMDKCNKKIRIERQRSMERIRQRGMSNNEAKDKANLSDEKVNNETEKVTN